MMCQLNNSVEVTILPPYIPSQKEQADPRIYASKVRRLFADTLQLPMVEQVCTGIRLTTPPLRISSTYGIQYPQRQI